MKFLHASVLLPFWVCYAHCFMDSMFHRHTLCDVETRMEKLCSRMISPIRSLMDCLALCNNENTCVGASIKGDFMCYLHDLCAETPGCGGVSNDHEYFSKNCHNGGIWNPAKNSCSCVDGWVGDECNKLPKSCNDLIDYAYQTGTHKATLDLSDKGLANTKVDCWIKSAPPTYSRVTVLNNAGRTSFDRDWDSYRSGFDKSDNQMFIGLRKWRRLSQAGYNTLTLRVSFSVSGLVEFDWVYQNFHLSSEADKYAFTFDLATNETSGNDAGYKLGNCLEGLQNISFSTWDMDDDSSTFDNCAQNAGSGWWYSGCNGACHLLGWGQGYKNLVAPERQIRLDGIDMDAIGDKLISIKLFLNTPP